MINTQTEIGMCDLFVFFYEYGVIRIFKLRIEE